MKSVNEKQKKITNKINESDMRHETTLVVASYHNKLKRSINLLKCIGQKRRRSIYSPCSFPFEKDMRNSHPYWAYK